MKKTEPTIDLTTLMIPKRIDEYHQSLNVPLTHLAEAIKDRTLSRRVLLAGPSGCGKTSLAMLIASGVNCEDKVSQPCGTCERCQNTYSRIAFDIHRIDSVSIGVQYMREFRDTLNQTPMIMKDRVVILDEAQKLTADTQQQLLKILDDYPSTYFVLCTTDPQKINKALMNRFSVYTVSPLSMKASLEYSKKILKKIDKNIPDADLKSILQESNGVPRSILINIQSYLSGLFSPAEQEEDENKYAFLKLIVSKKYPAFNDEVKNSTSSADEIRRAIMSGCLGGMNKGTWLYGAILEIFLPPLVYDSPKTDLLFRAWKSIMTINAIEHTEKKSQ